MLFLDPNIPYIIITAEQYFMKLSDQRIVLCSAAVQKKVLAAAGIEPAPSDMSFRNATITPGCFIVIYIDLHAFSV